MIVFTDGGCRDNPGPGAWAFVIQTEDGQTLKYSGFLPYCTNNQAEYRALEAALITISNMELDAGVVIDIFSDSQLMVEQMNGGYRVNETMRPYYESAFKVLQVLRTRVGVKLTHIPRAKNSDADLLCNEVMDRHKIVSSRKGIRRIPEE